MTTKTENTKTKSAGPREAAGMSKKMDVTLLSLQWTVGLAFFLTGLSKFFFPLDIFEMIGFGMWYQYLAGVLEVLGAVFLVRRRWAALTGVALLAFAAVALYHHATSITHSPVGMILLAIGLAIIAWGRRKESIRLLPASAPDSVAGA